MSDRDKKIKAVEIFKSNLPEARGEFRMEISRANQNEVEFFNGSSLYCTINVSDGEVIKRNMQKLITIKEFASEINVSYKLAHGMANSEIFEKHKISYDIALDKEIRKKTSRRNKNRRIAIDKYYNALERGII